MIRSFAGRAAAFLLCPALVLGQTAGPNATFQITSRIVYVDVVVRDQSGHIVRGLTDKDFRVTEDGKAQKIDFFHDYTQKAVPAAASGAREHDPMSFSMPQTSGLYVVDVDEAAFRRLLIDGMPARQELKLAPGRYRLRLAVCDLGNRRIGTLDMPVVVGR